MKKSITILKKDFPTSKNDDGGGGGLCIIPVVLRIQAAEVGRPA